MTPTKLGRYEILDELGKGAMGIVYLARDPLIGRLVALKTFRIGYSLRDHEMEQFRARFIREAQSAGILSHPNIVTIHDVAEEAGDGLSFIAMEYVRGTNLKHVLQSDQPLPLSRIAEIVGQIADALDYAHSHGVIHRDVKPANIIITDDHRVKITDFGIARLNSSNLTQEGQLLGTPNYMAPEQVQGREVDHRADLFALGVVLYEMLTRHKPFQGENLTVVSHRIVYDHFTPPRDYVKNLPPPIERVLTRALEKDPNRRYQRARELAEDLRRAAVSEGRSEDLNETQSLSATVVLPSPPPLPMPPGWQGAAAARPSLLSRWFGRKPAAAPPAPAVPAMPALPIPPPPPLPADGTVTPGSVGAATATPLPSTITPPSGTAVPLSGTGTGAGTGTGTSASHPPAPAFDTAASLSVPPPAPPRPKRHLVAIGVSVLTLVVLVGAVLLLWLAWSRPANVVEQATDPMRDVRVLELIRQGHNHMRHARFDEATRAYGEAEKLAPDVIKLRDLQVKAQEYKRELERLTGEETEVATQLDKARKAIAARRYMEAGLAANEVLGLRPDHVEATEILTKASEASTQVEKRIAQIDATTPRPGAQSSSDEGTTEAETLSPTDTTEAVHAAAQLQMLFTFDISPGQLTIYAGDRQIYSQPFSVTEKKKFFGRERIVYKGGELKETLEVPSGSTALKVQVTVGEPNEKKTTKTWELTENLSSGSSHRLNIRVTKSKQLIANLR
ncbi:MAG TPA: serine/threonine-protein kinase [Thermoanaerobaculia bacterium]|nr:serine/threonine-protein kinase [Thermoanaerobaculia bacterium]